jgi:ABC-type Na+ efflux pump permease subunit
MKRVFAISVKEIRRFFIHPFNSIMMFAAPLLVTFLLYMAFGGLSAGGGPETKRISVIVVNNDTAAEDLDAGGLLLDFLTGEGVSDLLAVETGASVEAAEQALRDRQADLSLIIPEELSQTLRSGDLDAELLLLHDPTLTVGPQLVSSLVRGFLQDMTGASIAAQVLVGQLVASGIRPENRLIEDAAHRYSEWAGELRTAGAAGDPIAKIVPASRQEAAEEQQPDMIAVVMISMAIFFIYMMGSNAAESMVREREEGTMARIRMTPTARSQILGGHFLSDFLILSIQTAVLLTAGSLLFSIRWGALPSVFLSAFAMVVLATGFGLFLMSFVKNSRQTGPVTGGVMAVMGMLGGLFTSGIPDADTFFATISLLTPHGLSLYSWKKVLGGAGAADLVLPALISAAAGLVFLSIGMVKMRSKLK